MTAQNKSYITLDSCITDYLTESEQNNSKYFKLWHLAFRGLEQMGLDFFYKIKSVKLPINDNFTVTLPADYLNWTKVGILNERGEIIPLYYNSNLTTYADLSPDRLANTQDDTNVWSEWDATVWANFWNGWRYSNIYGVPSGEPFVGQFKIDNDNGVILLTDRFRHTYLMLEYVCAPKEGQDYYLPVQFREAMIAWLAWKDSNAKSIKSHMMLGDKRDKRREFYNERRLAIARWKPIRKQEIYQSSQEMTRMAVKS